MEVLTIDAVDARLAQLLDDFDPAEVIDRQRAEDLVASTLAMYGAAFRRMRALAEEHEAHSLAGAWSDRSPLGGLLRLHRADSPAPPPAGDDEVRQAIASVEAILDELDAAAAAVRERSVEMLTIVSDLHEAGLAQITGVADAELQPPAELGRALARDNLVATVLLIHGLHPEPQRERLRLVVEDLDRRGGAIASLRIVDLTADGVHLGIDASSPNDAHRFRLEVERTLAERLPDLPVASIDGGEAPVQTTTVTIPVESLTVRRSTPAVDGPR